MKKIAPDQEKLWDQLADRFNTHKVDGEIHPDAAVNIHVGWPTMFYEIGIHCDFLGKSRCSILDYGCGAGKLLGVLNKAGHDVVGMDLSSHMISLARKNLPEEVKLYPRKDFKEVFDGGKYEEHFDIVTSVHVFDWIRNIRGVIQNLSKVLKKDGLIMFAVFPRKHVVDSLVIKDLFEEFDSAVNPQKGICNFDGVKVPVYVKNALYYDRLMSELNFDKVFEIYPPYPSNFFKKYNWTASKEPEMCILGYRKN